MSRFRIIDGLSVGDTFPGAFHLAFEDDASPATGEEQSYLDAISRVMAQIHISVEDDPKGEDEASTAVREARKRRRSEMLLQLKKDVTDVNNGSLRAALAADRVHVIRGKYEGDLDRFDQSLFTVEPVIDETDNRSVSDILIGINEPIVKDPSDQAKRELYVALKNARTVVEAVAQKIEERADRVRFDVRQRRRERYKKQARGLRTEYLSTLVDIGRIGLQGPHVEHAKLALDAFRAEFVAREAGRIKNDYVWSLGIVAWTAALVLFIIYAIVEHIGEASGFWYTYRVFILGSASAAIGTWLSFSIRRVTLRFEDLAVLEEDMLDPSLRVLFVITLTNVVFLLFWTGAMNIEIGDLKTGDLSYPTASLSAGAIACLVGIFCGISERTLMTAVSGRAAAFVKSVGS